MYVQYINIYICICRLLVTEQRELIAFQEQYADIVHSRQLIYTKVFNEQKTVKLRAAAWIKKLMDAD